MTEHVIPELDRKGLREFGLVTGAIVAVLFGLFFPWICSSGAGRSGPGSFLAYLAVLGLIAPMALNPVYKIWMRFGLIMSKIMTPLIMSIVFYIVITPVGFVPQDYLRRIRIGKNIRRHRKLSGTQQEGPG